MSSQLAHLSPTLPPAGTPAVVPGGPAGVAPGHAPVAPAPPEDPVVVELLRQIVSVLTQLLAVSTAQAGAAAVAHGSGTASGGGSPGAPAGGARTPNVVSLESLSAAAAGAGSALGGDAGWSGAFTIHASSGGVTGGGTAVDPGPATSTLGGSGDSSWSIVTGADAGPVAAGAHVVAGGAAPAPAPAPAAPQVDMRRLSGTPQAGGVIDAVLRSVSATAAAARSDGTWMVLTDGNGARLQAHVHGAWASQPERIADGIQRGIVQVHLHADGTLHLHDAA